MEGGDFSGYVRAASSEGYDLKMRQIPSSGLSAGFYAALDGIKESVIAVAPLFSGEVVAAADRYPSKTFLIADEVPGLDPSNRIREVRFSRVGAFRDAGIFCAKYLNTGDEERFAALFTGYSTQTPSGQPGTAAGQNPEESGDAAFTTGFTTILPDTRLVRYPMAPGTVEPPFLTASLTGGAPSPSPQTPRPIIAAVLMGADSPQVSARLTDRDIPVVTESDILRTVFDNRLLASIEGDRAAAFAAELGAIKTGSPPPPPFPAAFVVTDAGKAALR